MSLEDTARKRSCKDVVRSAKPENTHAKVGSINALSPTQFTGQYLSGAPNTFTTTGGDVTCTLEFYAASELSRADFTLCFQLLRHTSSAAYRASSRGWLPEAKEAEMRDKDMHYLLVRRSNVSENRSTAQEHGPFEGFLSFMLTVEDDYPVIYIYEIHLSSSVRRCGLGRYLMRLVEDIGFRAGVAKAMLTVFTSNTRAEAFYRNLGYTVDEFSPRPRKLRGGRTKGPDYIIMSKALNQGGSLSN